MNVLEILFNLVKSFIVRHDSGLQVLEFVCNDRLTMFELVIDRRKHFIGSFDMAVHVLQ